METGQFVLNHLFVFQLVFMLLTIVGSVALISLCNLIVAVGNVILEKYRNFAKANAEQGDASLALDNR